MTMKTMKKIKTKIMQQTGDVTDTLHHDDDVEEDELEDLQQDQEQDSNPTESDEQQMEQMNKWKKMKTLTIHQKKF